MPRTGNKLRMYRAGEHRKCLNPHRAVPLADRFQIYLLRVDGEAWKIGANSPRHAIRKARRWLYAGRYEVINRVCEWLDRGPNVMDRVES